MPEDEPSGQASTRVIHKYPEQCPKSDILMLSQKSRGQSIIKKSATGLRGVAQWEAIMKKFSEDHKETCKSVPKELPLTHRDLKTFPSGSTYIGTWNVLGMSGEGTYTFPHGGVVYKGGFDEGLFHGDGELQYECGAIIKGKWDKGQLIKRQLFFADGLEYDENDWAYCRPADRRFTIEYDEGLEPAGRSYKTAEQPTIPIPSGYYDVGDGFYDPITKLVYKYNDLSAIERSPTKREQQWIMENCRASPDLPVGPCPFLYEKWVKPSLKLPVVPQPELHSNANNESEQNFQKQASVRSKASRGHLFTSRVGLCSKTAFYIPGTHGLDSTKLNDSVFEVNDSLSETITIKESNNHVAVPSGWGLTEDPIVTTSHLESISKVHFKAEKLAIFPKISSSIPKVD